MNDTQFSTLLRLIAELSDKIDLKIDELRREFTSELKKHRKQCHDEHMEILRAMELPYIEHEKRITNLEQAIYQ